MPHKQTEECDGEISYQCWHCNLRLCDCEAEEHDCQRPVPRRGSPRQLPHSAMRDAHELPLDHRDLEAHWHVLMRLRAFVARHRPQSALARRRFLAANAEAHDHLSMVPLPLIARFVRRQRKATARRVAMEAGRV